MRLSKYACFHRTMFLRCVTAHVYYFKFCEYVLKTDFFFFIVTSQAREYTAANKSVWTR